MGPVVFWNVALHFALYHVTAVGDLSGIWFRLRCKKRDGLFSSLGVKGETTVGLYPTLSCDLLAHLGQGHPQDNLQRGQPSLGDYLGLSTFCFELNCGWEAKHLYKVNEVQLLSFLKTSITWMTENLHRLSTSVAFQGDILKSLFVKHFIQFSYSLCAVLCPSMSHLCSIRSFVIPVFIPPEQHSANIKLLNCFCVFQHNSSVKFSCLLLIFSSC